MNNERFNGIIQRIEYSGHPDYCDIILNKNNETNNALTLRKVVSDPHRIKLIITKIKELYEHENQHSIFVFAEHRDYLIMLRTLLLDQFDEDTIIDLEDPDLNASDNSGSDDNPDDINLNTTDLLVLRGGASKNLVQHVRKSGAKIVLTTYGYSRRGIDLPNMTAMILVTPRRSGLMQILGRITRKRSDLEKIRIVIDIVDAATIYKGQWYERKQVYDAKEWTISKENHSFESYI